MTPNEITERLVALERRVQNSETQSKLDRTRLAKSERKLRVTWAVSALAALVTLTIGWHKDAIAQGYGMTLAQAATHIAALETKTASMSVLAAGDSTNTSGAATVRFTNVNVQVVSGSGNTEGTVNGTGNLIVGYNELRTPSNVGGAINTRTGSHNLVVGLFNNYSGDGGAVIGYQNSISNLEACVLGGFNNMASGISATVSGGYKNTASGNSSSVSGGFSNTAKAQYASVSGGQYSTASGSLSSVSGGSGNTAGGDYSSVSGGQYNKAGGTVSSVSGGQYVQQANMYGFSAGGQYTQASPGVGTFHSP